MWTPSQTRVVNSHVKLKPVWAWPGIIQRLVYRHLSTKTIVTVDNLIHVGLIKSEEEKIVYKIQKIICWHAHAYAQHTHKGGLNICARWSFAWIWQWSSSSRMVHAIGRPCLSKKEDRIAKLLVRRLILELCACIWVLVGGWVSGLSSHTCVLMSVRWYSGSNAQILTHAHTYLNTQSYTCAHARTHASIKVHTQTHAQSHKSRTRWYYLQCL